MYFKEFAALWPHYEIYFMIDVSADGTVLTLGKLKQSTPSTWTVCKTKTLQKKISGYKCNYYDPLTPFIVVTDNALTQMVLTTMPNKVMDAVTKATLLTTAWRNPKDSMIDVFGETSAFNVCHTKQLLSAASVKCDKKMSWAILGLKQRLKLIEGLIMTFPKTYYSITELPLTAAEACGFTVIREDISLIDYMKVRDMCMDIHSVADVPVWVQKLVMGSQVPCDGTCEPITPDLLELIHMLLYAIPSHVPDPNNFDIKKVIDTVLQKFTIPMITQTRVQAPSNKCFSIIMQFITHKLSLGHIIICHHHQQLPSSITPEVVL